jgi:hypothetical protein
MGFEALTLCIPGRLLSGKFGVLNVCFISLHLFVYRVHEETIGNSAEIQFGMVCLNLTNVLNVFEKNRGGAVGTAVGYWIDDRKVGVRVLVGKRISSCVYCLGSRREGSEFESQ